MGATKPGTTVQVLDLDVAIIESLPEPVLSELVGFLEYDNRLACESRPSQGKEVRNEAAAGVGCISAG